MEKRWHLSMRKWGIQNCKGKSRGSVARNSFGRKVSGLANRPKEKQRGKSRMNQKQLLFRSLIECRWPKKNPKIRASRGKSKAKKKNWRKAKHTLERPRNPNLRRRSQIKDLRPNPDAKKWSITLINLVNLFKLRNILFGIK